jgi:cytochrome c oxidase subunit 1
MPVIDSLTPLWTHKDGLMVMTGLSVDRREVLVTSVIEAEPEYRQKSPKPSIAPLFAAIAVTILFVGSIFTPWALVWGAVPVAITLTIWFWPQRPRAVSGPLRVRRP